MSTRSASRSSESAARRAAERFDPDAEASLDGALRDLAEAYASGERARIVHGNTAFHAALSEASGSRWLVRLLRPMLETSERFGAALILDQHAEEVYAVEAEGHREIVAACQRADPDGAEEALCRHLAVFEALFEREFAVWTWLAGALRGARGLAIPGRGSRRRARAGRACAPCRCR